MTDYSKRNSDSSRGRGHGLYSQGRGQGPGRGNSQNQGQRDSSKNREDNRQKDQKGDYEANLSETHEGDVNHEEVPLSVNRLYKAQLKVGKPYCLKANIDEESWLWHVQLCHIGFGAMNLMHKLAKGVPVIKHQDQVCESCMVGEQTNKSFSKKATYRASKILEMVHGDICGPITPSTQAAKSDVFRVIKRFKTPIENEIITFHMDRGDEFTSHDFNRFCDKEGIVRMLTAPYAPQQNGIMKRRNQTLLEMTRFIMKARGLLNYFWGEAVRHATYIINRTHTRALVRVTPYEKLRW
nr:zinc finger, CCHC-type [Tanacetum cinerariifolium]